MEKKGKLYLIPTPLGTEQGETIPSYVVEILHGLTYLVAERAKTARHFIKQTSPPKPINEFIINELNEHSDKKEIPVLLSPVLEGHDLGLLSEAGCPGVADPGAALVHLAHKNGVEVVPLVGPSSILLALMASGMNGQRFCFHGYLSSKPGEFQKDLKRLEKISQMENQTQIFIEAPYRNRNVIEQALQSLQADTLFCICADLTMPTQFVKTHRVAAWQKDPPPDLHKRPAIFLVLRGK